MLGTDSETDRPTGITRERRALTRDFCRDDEILVAVAVTDSGRPAPRIGGLQKHEIKGQDGLR